MELNTFRHTLLQTLISIIYFTSVISLAYAQTSNPNFRLEYEDNLITILAQNADLKNVLLKLANETNIIVRFPNSLKKQITIKLSKHPLNEVLSRILKGLDHAIIYSASKKDRTVVAKVIVYNKSEESKILNRSNPRDKDINDRIKEPLKKINRSRLLKSLERRLKNLNEKWSLGNISSSQRERYLKQIRAYEDEIEKLKREIQ
jgi:hypothetical protein